MGRKTKYTPELLEEVCQRLSVGEPLAMICRSEGMPDPATVWRWAEKDEKIAQAIAYARELGEDYIAADCLNIADDNSKDIRYLPDGREMTDADVVQRAKLRIDTRLKLLAKWNPKKWGDKVDLTSDNKALNAPMIQVLPPSAQGA